MSLLSELVSHCVLLSGPRNPLTLFYFSLAPVCAAIALFIYFISRPHDVNIETTSCKSTLY